MRGRSGSESVLIARGGLGRPAARSGCVYGAMCAAASPFAEAGLPRGGRCGGAAAEGGISVLMLSAMCRSTMSMRSRMPYFLQNWGQGGGGARVGACAEGRVVKEVCHAEGRQQRVKGQQRRAKRR